MLSVKDVDEVVTVFVIRLPPFYERFQEERDKRFTSEIARLEGEVRHNGQRLDELREDVVRLDGKIESVRAELKEDIARLDDKIDKVRDELKGEITGLRREMQTQFRWMVGLLLPVVLGVVTLLIQNLLSP